MSQRLPLAWRICLIISRGWKVQKMVKSQTEPMWGTRCMRTLCIETGSTCHLGDAGDSQSLTCRLTCSFCAHCSTWRRHRAKDGEVPSAKVKPVLHQRVVTWDGQVATRTWPGSRCSVVGRVVWEAAQGRAALASLSVSLSVSLGSRRTHLAGLGVHVPTGEEFLHHAHVLLCFHGGQRCQHDGGIPCLVLMIHVTHVCKDTSLLREKPAPNTSGRYGVWKNPVKWP